jgi:hypothetical protein
LLPKTARVILLADREYSSVAVIRFCLRHGWHFCLRARKNRWLLDPKGRRQRAGTGASPYTARAAVGSRWTPVLVGGQSARPA